ncbi:hypothetical protein D3C84_868140 [compost metagenome]
MHRLGVGELADLEGLHPIEEGAVGIGIVGVEIDQRTGRARGVPLLAAGHAGMAADADVEVDDQGELRHE